MSESVFGLDPESAQSARLEFARIATSTSGPKEAERPADFIVMEHIGRLAQEILDVTNIQTPEKVGFDGSALTDYIVALCCLQTESPEALERIVALSEKINLSSGVTWDEMNDYKYLVNRFLESEDFGLTLEEIDKRAQSGEDPFAATKSLFAIAQNLRREAREREGLIDTKASLARFFEMHPENPARQFDPDAVNADLCLFSVFQFISIFINYWRTFPFYNCRHHNN